MSSTRQNLERFLSNTRARAPKLKDGITVQDFRGNTLALNPNRITFTYENSTVELTPKDPMFVYAIRAYQFARAEVQRKEPLWKQAMKMQIGKFR